MALYIANALSLNMIDMDCSVHIEQIALERAKACIKVLTHQGEPPLSVVGHADTAQDFTEALDHPVPHNRATLSLQPGDILIVGQYKGDRLQEGAQALPPAARIKWYRVSVRDPLWG